MVRNRTVANGSTKQKTYHWNRTYTLDDKICFYTLSLHLFMGVARKSDATILYCITTSVKKKHFPESGIVEFHVSKADSVFRCANETKRHYSSNCCRMLDYKKMLSNANLNVTFIQHKSGLRSTENVAQHVTVQRDWTKVHGAHFKYLCPVQSTHMTSLSVQKLCMY